MVTIKRLCMLGCSLDPCRFEKSAKIHFNRSKLHRNGFTGQSFEIEILETHVRSVLEHWDRLYVTMDESGIICVSLDECKSVS